MHVIGFLKQADPPCAARSFKDCLHQLSSNSVTLNCGIGDNGADCPDRVSLTKKVEADNPAAVILK